MKVLSFLNNKGGVGKTASVSTLSHLLAAEYGKRVLIVDLDPQGNVSNLFGQMDIIALIKARRGEPVETVPYSVGDLLVNTDMDVHIAVKKTNYMNLDIIPSLPTLSAVEEQLKADIKTPQQFRLANHLQKLDGEYDYCLIDCSPSLSILNVNALVASDEVYIPTLADADSLFGIELTKTELIDEVRKYSPRLKIGGIYFTKYEKRLNVSKYAKEILGIAYERNFLPISINKNSAVQNCTHEHKPLGDYDKGMKLKATRDYHELAGYIAAPNRRMYLKALARKEA